MVYYLYKCYAGPGRDPAMTGKQIQGRFKVSDGFNQKASCTMFCSCPKGASIPKNINHVLNIWKQIISLLGEKECGIAL